jgi:hypothetical protein
MLEFKLPVINNEAPIEAAFEPMIRNGVAGIITPTNTGHRLLHYSQLQGALAAGKKAIGEIQGYVEITNAPTDPQPARSAKKPDYLIRGITESMADVWSRREAGAAMYITSSPGYTCSGNPPHFYPPLRRGEGNNCMVFGCSGTLP